MWKWLSGKKRTIALGYWTIAVPVVAIWWPTGAPDNIDKIVAVVGVVLSAVGLGHAALKTYKVRKNGKKAATVAEKT